MPICNSNLTGWPDFLFANVVTLSSPEGGGLPLTLQSLAPLSNPPSRGSYAHLTCFLKTRLNNQEETLRGRKLCSGFAGQSPPLCGPLTVPDCYQVSQTSWGVIFTVTVEALRAPYVSSHATGQRNAQKCKAWSELSLPAH